MPIEPTRFRFDDDDREPVLRVMRELAPTGAGWINLEPDVDQDDLPPAAGGLFQVFSASSRQVPLCTWSPPEPRAKYPYVSLGLQHGLGVGAAKYLARDVGLARDPRWRVLTDQPRRGTVVAVPVDDDFDEVLLWLLAAGTALCPAPFGGRWHAAVYRRPS